MRSQNRRTSEDGTPPETWTNEIPWFVQFFLGLGVKKNLNSSPFLISSVFILYFIFKKTGEHKSELTIIIKSQHGIFPA